MLDLSKQKDKLKKTVEDFCQYEPDVAYLDRTKLLFQYLEVQDDSIVLDCGCGLGTHSAILKKINPKARVVGLEYDEARLRDAKETVENNMWIRGSVYQLPFPDETFDKILCSEVLEHLECDNDALRELWRVLKPNGVLALSVPYLHYPFVWDPVNKIRTMFGFLPIRDGLFSGAWTDHKRLYEVEDLKKKLLCSNFYVLDNHLSTSRCFLFAHLWIYRIGKLFSGNKGVLARKIRFGEGELSRFSFLYLAVNIFKAFGKNHGGEKAFINLTMKATKC